MMIGDQLLAIVPMYGEISSHVEGRKERKCCIVVSRSSTEAEYRGVMSYVKGYGPREC